MTRRPADAASGGPRYERSDLRIVGGDGDRPDASAATAASCTGTGGVRGEAAEQRLPRSSGLATQARQRERDQPTNRRLGRQASGGPERVEAEGGQLGRCDVVPDPVRLGGRDQQVLEKVGQRLVRPGYVLTSVDQGRHLRRAVSAPVVRDECVGGEHRFQLLAPGRRPARVGLAAARGAR